MRFCQKQLPEGILLKVFLKISQNSIKKDTLAQVLSSKIFKNTFLTSFLWNTSSGWLLLFCVVNDPLLSLKIMWDCIGSEKN